MLLIIKVGINAKPGFNSASAWLHQQEFALCRYSTALIWCFIFCCEWSGFALKSWTRCSTQTTTPCLLSDILMLQLSQRNETGIAAVIIMSFCFVVSFVWLNVCSNLPERALHKKKALEKVILSTLQQKR